MVRQTDNKQIQNFINAVKKSIHEPIIEKSIGIPPIDEDKAFFLLLPFLNGEKWTEEIYKAALSVGSVHAAFDAHDCIDAFNATSTEQQLTILSGDYFSGIHYRLLASIPDFSFIRSLSETIGLINETKTNVLKTAPADMNQLNECITTIETACIVNFYEAYGFSEYSPIVKVIMPLLWLESRMSSEKKSGSRKYFDIQLDDELTNELSDYLSSHLQKVVSDSELLNTQMKQEIVKIAMPMSQKPI